MRRLVTLLSLLLLCGCPPAAPPCSEAEAAQAVAVCVAREQVECKPTPEGKKDTTCKAYVECKATLDKWEACE